MATRGSAQNQRSSWGAAALLLTLALGACAGGAMPVRGPETTTRDINEDIRATLPAGLDQNRPALPGSPESPLANPIEPPVTSLPLPPPH